MWKLNKVIFLVAVIIFIVNCSKNKDEKNIEIVNNNVDSVKVADTHDHSHTKGLKEGDLTIDPIASEVAKYSMDGKYEEAIQVLIDAKDVPGYQWDAKRLYDSIIYLYNKTKQYDKNLDVWKDGHSKGIIFNMDKTQKHFEPYLKLDGFDEIYKKDLKLQKEFNK